MLNKSIIAQIVDDYGVTGDSDSYKYTHFPQYPKDATNMMSYVSSRGGRYDKTVWQGLQPILMEYFNTRLTHKHVDNIVEFEKEHFMGNFPEDLENALRIVVVEFAGRLPLLIRSIQEGMVVPVNNCLMTIELTVDDRRLLALPSFFEASLQRVWDCMTVATKSWHMRQVIMKALEESSDNPEAEIWFKLHDFGSRGVGTMACAAFTGMGHFSSFMGSDTVVAILAAKYVYACQMAAYSIPASEHSTTTAHGRNGEEQLVTQMFDAYCKPNAFFATVIDSYDAINFLDNIVPKFLPRLRATEGATWVIRPDSGDPVQMPIECVRRLGRIAGFTVNTKGFKVLNNVRVIQGDGITEVEVAEILRILLAEGWSATNIAFGMGGGLLRKHDRDTQKVSMKCCAIKRNGQWFDVYKDPAVYDENWVKTNESSFKKSRAGRLLTVYCDGDNKWETIRESQMDTYAAEGYRNMLEDTWRDGVLVRTMTMDQIRTNAHKK